MMISKISPMTKAVISGLWESLVIPCFADFCPSTDVAAGIAVGPIVMKNVIVAKRIFLIISNVVPYNIPIRTGAKSPKRLKISWPSCSRKTLKTALKLPTYWTILGSSRILCQVLVLNRSKHCHLDAKSRMPIISPTITIPVVMSLQLPLPTSIIM